jgi:hypothetical protein
MSQKFFDVVVAKEYETNQSGRMEKRTAWNKVGRAWPSKSGESVSFELFLLPNLRYVVHLRDRNQEQPQREEPDAEQVSV